MKLRRPLAVLDLETTGTAPEVDRIVEIAVLKVHPSGRESRFRQRVNPEIRIPPEATRVHGIRNCDVQRRPVFRKIARRLARFLRGCDLAGFNLMKFDLPLLEAEFRRAGIPFTLKSRRIIDAYRIFTIREPRSLSAAYRFYCGRKQRRPHSAVEDARVCWEVLQGELKRYPDLPRSVGGLHQYLNHPPEAS